MAILFFLRMAGGALAAQSEIDPALLSEVKQLVVSRVMRDEAIPKIEAIQKHPDRPEAKLELEKLRAELDGRVRQQIRTRPGLKPYLFILLERAYRGPNPHPYEIPRILEALAMRDDLKPEDVEMVRREVAHNFANPILDYEHRDERSLQEHYLAGAMAVLARDLTPESEDLMLQGLAWPHLDVIKVMASRALADAGVVRSLPAMQAAYDRFTATRHPYAKLILEDLQILKGKSAIPASSPSGAPSSQIATRIPPNPPIAVAERGSSFSRGLNGSAWAWALGIIGVAGGVLLVWKRRA